ncbi:hypothetical protein BV898_18196 [Hypsibius exemplaris]|uniref:Uncharacterized protein n=1 Tax=Hypsibius exemplaris TaxID=2072580 RepID=A0A9X6NGE5_HYPEX|nr:hypothetical protein BV898_18196 [Hypsibius exemplaris]
MTPSPLLETYAKKTNWLPLDFEGIKSKFFLILNAAADTGKLEVVQRLWGIIALLVLVEPTSIMCGPLVRVHLVNNDRSRRGSDFQSSPLAI